jgi:uncharacterized iron-regulated membrane protein
MRVVSPKTCQSAVKTAHIWIGLIFGAFLCITCLSGSIAVFRPELESAFSPQVAPSDVRANLDDAVKPVLASNPGWRLTRVLLPVSSRNTFILTLEAGEKRQRRIIVDAGTGAIAGELRLPWLDWVIDLHHNFLAGRAGRRVVGGIGVVLFLVSASGFLLSLTRKPSWRSLVLITVRRSGLRRRFYFELHRATGLWAYAFLTLLSLTGIALAYPEALRSTSGTRVPIARTKSSRSPSSRSLEEYLAAGRAALPFAQLTELRLPRSSKDPINLRFRVVSDLGNAGRNELILDPAGRVLGTRYIAEGAGGARLQSASTAIHYGEVGGFPIKLLWCFAGIAPTLLFVTGLLFWFRGNSRRDVARNPPRQESRNEFLVTQRTL